MPAGGMSAGGMSAARVTAARVTAARVTASCVATAGAPGPGPPGPGVGTGIFTDAFVSQVSPGLIGLAGKSSIPIPGRLPLNMAERFWPPNNCDMLFAASPPSIETLPVGSIVAS